jgi:hypothetical protein
MSNSDKRVKFSYKAEGNSDLEIRHVTPEKYEELIKWERKSKRGWQPSIFMPREAARLFLSVKSVRVERLHEISEIDAFYEGIDEESEDFLQAEHYQEGGSPVQGGSPAVFTFIGLWDRINVKRGYGWDTNCWVWVVEFEKA